MELTKEMKDELNGICQNSISHAAFSGMVFNAVRDLEAKGIKISDEDIKILTKQALNVRVIIRGMNNE